MLARTVAVVVITSSIIPLVYPQSCWEENQSSHQMSDFKNNSKVFQYLAFGIEENITGSTIPVDKVALQMCKLIMAGQISVRYWSLSAW